MNPSCWPLNPLISNLSMGPCSLRIIPGSSSLILAVWHPALGDIWVLQLWESNDNLRIHEVENLNLFFCNLILKKANTYKKTLYQDNKDTHLHPQYLRLQHFFPNHDYVLKFPSQLMINYNQQEDGRPKLITGWHIVLLWPILSKFS